MIDLKTEGYWGFGLILLALIAVCSGCTEKTTDTVRQPPDLAIVPDTVAVGDRSYWAEARPWRDLMPGEVTGLLVWAAVLEVDSLTADSGLVPSYIWVANGEDVWGAALGEIERPVAHPYLVTAVARNGPTWAPETKVQAVIELVDSAGDRYLLRAPDAIIESAY